MSEPDTPPTPLPQPQAPRLPADPAALEQQAESPALRALEFRAALLLGFMALLVVAAVLYLMWVRGAFEATQKLYLTTDDSDGVVVGMDMSFSGFPIGRVSRIELADQGAVRIQVDVPVKAAHWLRSTSVFTLEKGLVGAARLRAFSGVPDDPPLPPEAERAVLRGDVSAEIPRMVADARDVLQNINSLTGADSALSASLAEVQRLAVRLNSRKGGVLGALTGNEADAQRVAELIERSSALVKSLDALARRSDGVLQKADRQLLGQGGQDGLVGDAHAAVRQLNALLQDARQSMLKVDGVLKDVQGVASNARSATADLDDLRADVDSSLARIDALITELNRKWPFAAGQKEVKLP